MRRTKNAAIAVLAGTVMALGFTASASAQSFTLNEVRSVAATPLPKLHSKQHKVYALLHRKASEPGVKVHAGRNVDEHGSPKDGRHSHNLVRSEMIRLYLDFNPAVRLELERVRSGYYRGPRYLYDVVQKQGVRAMVDAAITQAGLASSTRAEIHHIIRYESNYVPDVANHEGSGALGLVQFMPPWGSYAERTDPVWSILRMIRYFREEGDFQPWVTWTGRV